MSSSLSATIELPNGKSYEQPLGLFINNEFVASSSGAQINVIDPKYAPCHNPIPGHTVLTYIFSTGKSIVDVQAASQHDVDRAVAAARAAFEGDWRGVAAAERGKLLHKLADLIDRDRELLAAIDAYDNGKVCDFLLAATNLERKSLLTTFLSSRMVMHLV